MATVTKTTTSGNTGTTKQWWSGLINLQTLILIGAAFVSVVTFWNRQKDHGNHIDVLQKNQSTKAEQSDVKSIDDKVNRQYEQIRTVLDRIIVLEKAQEYQRGKQDALKEQNKN